MVKILFLTGSHPRHAFIARTIASTGMLAGLVIEESGLHAPSPPTDIEADLARLFTHHFASRAASEEKFFGQAALPDVRRLNIAAEELNSPKVHAFIQEIKPDIVLSYGIHKLSDETLNRIDAEKWNLHGGLSPWYKGVITHFWPSYMLQPQYTGMTLHHVTAALDAGDIIHQSVAEMVRGDGIHDVACRAVCSIAEQLPGVFNAFANGTLIASKKQAVTGKLWLGSDWHPSHLHLIYDVYGNKIVDHYLDGAFATKMPTIFRQPFNTLQP